MDRQIVYVGAIPQDTDLLLTNKNTMIGLGLLTQALLGTSTLVDGLACTPTGPASLQVLVGQGSIYAQEEVDASAYGSVAADTTHQIVKQGINLGTVTLNCPAPVTSGQSINYLIEAAYQDTDTGSAVLPYYNSSNPAVAYNGPNNTGVSQNTVRQGQCIVTVKTGVSATTGTQVTPTPDAGYTGLWVVTVANGQTTITSGNIVAYSGAPFISEKLTAKISEATGDARYLRIGSQVVLNFAQLTSSGNFTTPANITTATVFEITLVGGGGGAGGASGSFSVTGGAGAGGAAKFLVSGLSPSTAYAVTIGGAGGGGASGASGGAGGPTSIVIGATTYTANGGNLTPGTASATSASPAGQGGVNGSVSSASGYTFIYQSVSMNSFANSPLGIAGTGASTPFGTGGNGGSSGAGGGGTATGYGAGGGGAVGATSSGGGGSPGLFQARWIA